MSGSRGGQLRAAAQNRGRSAADLTVLLPEGDRPGEPEFSFSREPGLLGSNTISGGPDRQTGRQAVAATAPVPGPEGTPSLWLPSPYKY